MKAYFSLYALFSHLIPHSRRQNGESQTREKNYEFFTFPTKALPSGGSIMISHYMFEIFPRVPEVGSGHMAKISRTIDFTYLEISFEHQILASVFIREHHISST